MNEHQQSNNMPVSWEQQNPLLVQRGIDESTWNAITQTIFPGAKPESCLMAVDYCRARSLDIMMKPVHLVPMKVKDAQSGQEAWRDVVMPGVGLYRIQAARSGDYAGADAPEFGPMVTLTFGNFTIEVPEWCTYTVYKMIDGQRVPFSATEYWEENFASTKTGAPNSMWKKRKRGQIAKCAEAQAMRKAWPEVGQEPTAEEMEGKSYDIKDVTPAQDDSVQSLNGHSEEQYEKFHQYLSDDHSAIEFAGYIDLRVSDEQLQSLYNTFESGDKTAGKKRAAKKQSDGMKALQEVKIAMLSDDPETRESALDGFNEVEVQIAKQFVQK